MTATQDGIVRDRLYIAGGWVPPATNRVITPVSPSTEEPLGRVPEAAEQDVDRAVTAARVAFDDSHGWATWDVEERARVMERFADALDKRGSHTARLVSSQNGMPISTSQAVEGAFPAVALRYYAGLIKDKGIEERREGVFGRPTRVRHQRLTTGDH